MIVKELIQSSLRKLGVYASGEYPTADEVSDALNQINRMLHSWSVEANGIYTQKYESFSLTGGTQDYTYGSGGDFDSARPIRIFNCIFQDNGNNYNIIETTRANWMGIDRFNLQSYPRMFLYEPEFPKAKIKFWPVPDDSYTVIFYAVKPLAQYDNNSNDLKLPPEYEEAIEWNLAARLAPEYVGEATRTIMSAAQDTLNKLRTFHAQPVPQIKTNIGGQGERYNIYEGN